MSKESILQATSKKSKYARKETVTIHIFILSRNTEGKFKQPVATNSEHGTKVKKWNQFNQLSEAPTTVIPAVKT